MNPTPKPQSNAEIAALKVELQEAKDRALLAEGDIRAENGARILAETDRTYLWNALAKLEAWAATAPPEDIGRCMLTKLRAALDGFKPTLQVTRVMP